MRRPVAGRVVHEELVEVVFDVVLDDDDEVLEELDDVVLEEVVVLLLAKVAARIASPMTMNPLPMGVPKGTVMPVKVKVESVHSA